MKKIRVFIADDHKIVRMGLKALIASDRSLEVVGEADNGISAVKSTIELMPDVVIMDLMMPKKDGEQATAEIRAALPGTKVIILTSSSSTDRIAKAIEAGANGAVLKSSDDTSLLTAIRKALDGGEYLSPEIRRLLRTDPPTKHLSARQLEVLKLLARGLANTEIAQVLNLSKGRTEEIVSEVCERLEAANRTEAVAIALRRELV